MGALRRTKLPVGEISRRGGRLREAESSKVSNRNRVTRAGEVEMVPCRSWISAIGGCPIGSGSAPAKAPARAFRKVSETAAMTLKSSKRSVLPFLQDLRSKPVGSRQRATVVPAGRKGRISLFPRYLRQEKESGRRAGGGLRGPSPAGYRERGRDRLKPCGTKRLRRRGWRVG